MRKPLWTSGHRALRARLGNGLGHEGLGLVSAGQLHQHHLIGRSALRLSTAAVQAATSPVGVCGKGLRGARLQARRMECE